MKITIFQSSVDCINLWAVQFIFRNNTISLATNCDALNVVERNFYTL